VTLTSSHLAGALVVGGAIVILAGIALLSVPSALLVLAGAILVGLGLFAIEVNHA